MDHHLEQTVAREESLKLMTNSITIKILSKLITIAPQCFHEQLQIANNVFHSGQNKLTLTYKRPYSRLHKHTRATFPASYTLFSKENR